MDGRGNRVSGADESYVPMTDMSRGVSSSHSSDMFMSQEETISLQRTESKAASLTRAVMFGVDPMQKSSDTSITDPPSFTHQEIEGVDIDDIIGAKKKGKSLDRNDTSSSIAIKVQQKTNVRAAMGFWKLIWFDFKNWHKRWRVKHNESMVFRSYIKSMESNFGSAIGSLFVFTRWMMGLNLILSLMWIGLVILPTAVSFSYSSLNAQFAFKNILDGKGVIAELWLFYGSYSDSAGWYNTGLAYLFMVLFTYFGSLFIVLTNISASPGPNTASSFESRFKFSLMMWTSWDHSITSNEASVNLSKGITSVLKDNLYEVKASEDVRQRSGKEKCKVYSLRALAWLITIILIGGGCTGIVYLVIKTSFDEPDSSVVTEASSEKTDFWNVYGTTIVFSLINILVPFCIQLLPKIENYASGRDELNITLTRVFFLRMANLFALISSLFNTVSKSVTGCAGTILGQEMYKLVIMDTILHSSVQLAVMFCKHFWTRQKAEFNISSAVLVIIYRQALIWVGTLACPVLPVIGLLSNLVFFFVNYLIVSRTCKPPVKRWNQSRNTAFFSIFLLGSLCLLIPPAAVIIGSSLLINLGHTATVQYCGPFGGEKPTRAYTNFGLQQVNWLQQILHYLVSEPVLIPGFMVLFCMLVYQRSQLSEVRKQRRVLQAELLQEREESEKMLKKLQSMGIGVYRQ